MALLLAWQVNPASTQSSVRESAVCLTINTPALTHATIIL